MELLSHAVQFCCGGAPAPPKPMLTGSIGPVPTAPSQAGWGLGLVFLGFCGVVLSFGCALDGGAASTSAASLNTTQAFSEGGHPLRGEGLLL